MDRRVAVVTGGGNGIGRACCIRLAEEGAAVVAADIQEERAAETAAVITDAGGRAASLPVDVASAEDNAAMVALALDAFGRLDALITAAGVSHGRYVSGDLDADVDRLKGRLDYLERPGWDLVETDVEDFDRVLAVNLKGTLLSMQAGSRAMLEQGEGGSIVTVASVAAKNPDAGPLAYTASKAAVWMLTKKAARMLAPAGIRVNSIGPGYIDTNMTAVIDLIPRVEGARDLFSHVPMGRKGSPAEIANTALFLCSDESSYFTGEILHPSGGFFTG